MKLNTFITIPLLLSMLISCQQKPAQNTETMFTPLQGKVRFMNLDPGHFHASLVQKTMYEDVDPQVFVYAPDGAELEDYLARIGDYNARTDSPTSWEEKVYRGDDFFEKMIADKPGNVMVVSGNNAKKTKYILEAVSSGIHVLADKPMVITHEEFPMLEKAFSSAKENGVLLYDIMTERYEITTLMQKKLSQVESVFGQLVSGTEENPAITKESVHHFSKIVSGKQLIRPPWFFDTQQQGEGIVDVCTHLVDLVQWEAFPEVSLEKSDVEILTAKRWTTDLSPEMFTEVTSLETPPEYLLKDVDEGLLKVYSNGEINYKLKGVHAKVSVIWNFKAPEGSADTHYSMMRGSKCNLIIRQGADEDFKPRLYIEAVNIESPEKFTKKLEDAIQDLAKQYPGVELEEVDEMFWALNIPDSYKVGHEAHFGQVTEKYLEYLKAGDLPEWEIPNMIVKYHTTTEALKQSLN